MPKINNIISYFSCIKKSDVDESAHDDNHHNRAHHNHAHYNQAHYNHAHHDHAHYNHAPQDNHFNLDFLTLPKIGGEILAGIVCNFIINAIH